MAKTLGIPEEECFVVEDSTVGIQAGKAAGMTVAALEDIWFASTRARRISISGRSLRSKILHRKCVSLRASSK